jgi:hypothetical protein
MEHGAHAGRIEDHDVNGYRIAMSRDFGALKR